jgi:hypothetical protein
LGDAGERIEVLEISGLMVPRTRTMGWSRLDRFFSS